MQSFRVLSIVTTIGWLGGAALAQQQEPPRRTTAPLRQAAATYQPVATVQDLMTEVIDPASKVVFAGFIARGPSSSTHVYSAYAR